ncbi:MAG TPA: helix-hairpin-helix domain-containing protein [Epsilonproteobacteria bacterium]|jgi:competence protein ComEA|nr:helix-hairpin-helix domain-containing protein [Campylobacterota bacterium]
MKFLVFVMMSVTFLLAVVDINTASIKELSTLKGLGASKAKAIVAYRKGHCFKSVDELANVKGIGKKTVEKNRKDLKVGVCKK